MTNVTLSQTSIGGSGDNLGFTNPITVTICTTDDEENLTKNIKVITFPTTTAKKEKDTTSPTYGAKEPKILDILMGVEQRITVDGYLVNDTIGTYANDTNSLAEGKKSDLKKLFLGGGVINMKYEGQVFKVNMDKLSIKRERFDGMTGEEGIAEFSVKFTAVKGDNLGA